MKDDVSQGSEAIGLPPPEEMRELLRVLREVGEGFDSAHRGLKDDFEDRARTLAELLEAEKSKLDALSARGRALMEDFQTQVESAHSTQERLTTSLERFQKEHRRLSEERRVWLAEMEERESRQLRWFERVRRERESDQSKIERLQNANDALESKVDDMTRRLKMEMTGEMEHRLHALSILLKKVMERLERLERKKLFGIF